MKKLQDTHGVPIAEVFRHGSLQIELYKPEGVDDQTPHTRDEVYVVIAGSGHFVNGDTRQPFEAGEVLIVLAGVDHRFEDFTDDFSSWVRPVAAGRVLERGIQTLLARRRQFPEEACPGNTPHGADRASISVSSNR